MKNITTLNDALKALNKSQNLNQSLNKTLERKEKLIQKLKDEKQFLEIELAQAKKSNGTAGKNVRKNLKAAGLR